MTKLELIAVVLVLLLLAGVGAYWFGHTKGTDTANLACVTTHANDAANYQAAQTKAEQLARQAQSAADAQQIADLKKMAADAQAAAATAQQAADAAKAQSNTLTANLARLQNEDKTVSKWSGHCLPTSLLASLHPNTSSQTYPSACRAAGSGNTGAIPAIAGKPAASH